jgi:hypothetical protein
MDIINILLEASPKSDEPSTYEDDIDDTDDDTTDTNTDDESDDPSTYEDDINNTDDDTTDTNTDDESDDIEVSTYEDDINNTDDDTTDTNTNDESDDTTTDTSSTDDTNNDKLKKISVYQSFMDLYHNIQTVINKLSDFYNPSPLITKIIIQCKNNFNKLYDTTFRYMTTTFDTDTYLKNLQTYQFLLAAYRTNVSMIKKIKNFKEL